MLMNLGLYPVLFKRQVVSATVLSASSTGPTIVIPASAAAGDLAVLCDYAWKTLGSGDPGDVVPTGWTGLITDYDGDHARIRCSYKVLVGGDPGATVTGMNSTEEDKVMFVFRPSQSIVTVTPSTWLADATSGDPASQAISASGQATPIIVIGCAVARNNTVAFSTESPAFDAKVANSDANMLVGYKIYNTAPADHTVDMNDYVASNALASGYLKMG